MGLIPQWQTAANWINRMPPLSWLNELNLLFAEADLEQMDQELDRNLGGPPELLRQYNDLVREVRAQAIKAGLPVPRLAQDPPAGPSGKQ
jgi:hypothetical protein